MKIEITKKEREILGFEFVGMVVLIDDEPHIVAQTSFDKCLLISLKNGNRLSDITISINLLTEKSLIKYIQKEFVTDDGHIKIRFLKKENCELIINLD